MHIGLPLRGLLGILRQSMVIALLAAIGPALALWVYGPYPEVLVMPLVLGGAGGLAGFVGGIFLVQHPLRGEVMGIWSKIKQKAV